MHKTITLSEYVKKRNGVALGAPGSMTNMVKRSLGASSFYMFWQYWNPIWGYYLSRKVMKPLRQLLPTWLAIIMTFAVSGALHDLAITVVQWKLTFLFTPWFTFMSFIVLTTKYLGISYREYHWLIRASINISFVVVCLIVTRQYVIQVA
ncbi:acyltransferase [Colwellia sp. 1_MG-2023]|uniref:acyltransferase n=1 Tax=Colwellia sp. 1_MG-2023 TaxID=3062649 RepID=UPI0026E17B32|nr:acyltransferase [Colwellia sp. 1_MG-2023]MDO6447268.1 acyltransferase [Colwellia sp. 1_MG-2023]